MKKIMALILALILTVIFCGCEHLTEENSSLISSKQELPLDVAGGTIPEGATYTIGRTKEVLHEGALMPTECGNGDLFNYGDYTYDFYGNNANASENGWNVRAYDKTKSSYEEILERINGFDTLYMNGTFYNCSNLLIAPTIPDTVTSIISAFGNCSSLTTAPVIHENIKRMQMAFSGCSSLTGEIEINASFEDGEFMYRCFGNIKKPLVITGKSTTKKYLAEQEYEPDDFVSYK